MKINFYWEIISVGTHRAKVIGGWLVRYSDDGESMVFVKDPLHVWELE